VGYHQEMKIDSISIYKMDGLAVEINFLENDIIDIWDYAKWVVDIREYINAEITTLRAMMIQNEKLTALKLNRARVDFDNGEFDALNVDKEFLFTLRKYDLKSVIEPLFLYKEHKHKLLHQEMLVESADTTLSVDRKIFGYGQLLNTIRDSDTVLYQIDKRNINFSYLKYNSFLDEYYNGMDGITQFSTAEKNSNKDNFEVYVKEIQILASQKFMTDDSQGKIKYRRKVINDYIETIPEKDSITTNPITTHRIENLDGSFYLGGVFLNDKEGKISSFVCRKEADGVVSWYKDYLLQMDSVAADSHTYLSLLYGGQGGCTFVLHGEHVDSGAPINTFFRYNEGGEQLLAKNFDIESYPRTIDFVEESNSFLIGFNGDKLKTEGQSASTMTLANYNVRGNLNWQYSHDFVGTISGVVITDDSYLVSGNYSMIKGSAGKISRVSDGFATYILKLNGTGAKTKQQIFPSTTRYTTRQFFKAGDRCINIFGSKNPEQQTFETNDSDLVHFILTKDLVVLSNSLK
jgi:hypothetical protein